MKILSIDTSSKICGVSILDNKNLICNLDKETDKSHSENLMPMISQALADSDTDLNSIDLIVCDIGPGSFTGIRIGVATVKGFCDSLNIPSIGISSLEALAYPINNELICSLLDCKNNNCYFALYKKSNGILQTLIEPKAETLENALSTLKDYCENNFASSSVMFVGDGSISFANQIKESLADSSIKDLFADEKSNSLSSYYLALAGLDRYNSGNKQKEILPLYLKKPLAQRQLEEKEAKNEK